MKLTTKLLLGATLVTGLSISAFAACANHVDMGAKNLTNVATPTESHHAATKGYVDEIERVYVDASEVNSSAAHGARLHWVRNRNTVCLTGTIENNTAITRWDIPVPSSMQSTTSTATIIPFNSGYNQNGKGIISGSTAILFGIAASSWTRFNTCYVK